MTARAIRPNRAYRVRYQKTVGTSPWRECRAVYVAGEALHIRVDETREVLVPLHVIRGEIEIEELTGRGLPPAGTVSDAPADAEAAP